MQPRFVGRLGLADLITIANAGVGFLAVVAATVDVALAARLVLLAAVLDGLDGIVARQRGGTPVGQHLDSLADVASFGLAPAMIVYAVASAGLGVTLPSLASLDPLAVAAVGVPAVYASMAVARLGMYNAYDTSDHYTEGAPTTLGGTLVAAAVLVGLVPTTVLVAGTAVFAYLMVTCIEYPDLYPRDAFLMGVVQGLAIIWPDAFSQTFPEALLILGLAYLLAGPRFYWRDEGGVEPAGETPARGQPEGKRS
jgi:CDP-diacylglycerol--serine O-phosphatidyltransferase